MSRNTPTRTAWARLTVESDRALTDLVRKHGIGGAAKRLGCTDMLVDRLAYGGSASAESVARIEERLGAL